MKVEIWSDIACPWCYIGSRHLDDAVERFRRDARAAGRDTTVDIEFRSFELMPDAPADFPTEYLERQNGMSLDTMREYGKHVHAKGAEVGLDMRLEDLQHTNTALAHQALHHARRHGLQVELERRLMQAHFEQARHVGRIEDLAALAEEVGLDGAELAAALREDRYLDAVRADEAAARAIGVRSIPTFVADGRHAISGAVDSRELLEFLNTAATRTA